HCPGPPARGPASPPPPPTRSGTSRRCRSAGSRTAAGAVSAARPRSTSSPSSSGSRCRAPPGRSRSSAGAWPCPVGIGRTSRATIAVEGGTMIARIWKGAVRRRDGDAYARYMQHTGVAGVAGCAGPPGNRGVWMLRRDLGDRTEFVMFTLWESMEAVKAFAGDDHETAVFYPEDDRFLAERDHTAAHYQVDTQAGPDVA